MHTPTSAHPHWEKRDIFFTILSENALTCICVTWKTISFVVEFAAQWQVDSCKTRALIRRFAFTVATSAEKWRKCGAKVLRTKMGKKCPLSFYGENIPFYYFYWDHFKSFLFWET